MEAGVLNFVTFLRIIMRYAVPDTIKLGPRDRGVLLYIYIYCAVLKRLTTPSDFRIPLPSFYLFSYKNTENNIKMDLEEVGCVCME
jgi:hypothetical protein